MLSTNKSAHKLSVEARRKLTYCIETGREIRSLKSIQEQATDACDQIKKMIFKNGKPRIEFEDGFHFWGDSQGGIIMRQVFDTCDDIRKYVATLTFNGTPNLGVSKLPDLRKIGLPEKWYTGMVTTLASMVEYVTQKWVDDSSLSFLQYLNKDKKNAPLVERLLNQPKHTFEKLEAVNMIIYEDEHHVNPRNSTTFENNYNGTWSSFEHSPQFRKLGLDKLYEEGRLLFCFIPSAAHLQSGKVPKDEWQFFTLDTCSVTKKEVTFEEARVAFRTCTQQKLKKAQFGYMKCSVQKRVLVI